MSVQASRAMKPRTATASCSWRGFLWPRYQWLPNGQGRDLSLARRDDRGEIPPVTHGIPIVCQSGLGETADPFKSLT